MEVHLTSGPWGHGSMSISKTLRCLVRSCYTHTAVAAVLAETGVTVAPATMSMRLLGLLLIFPALAEDAGCDGGKEKGKPGVLLMQTKPGSLLKAEASASQIDLSMVLGEVKGLQQQMSAMMTKMDSCCCGGQNQFSLAETGLCAIFGDPHFITFDGAETTIVGDIVHWLVKTSSVKMQGLSKGSEGFVAGLAASGDFLSGHRLVVMRDTINGNITVTYDGTEILKESVDTFDVSGVLKAYRRDTWDSDLFDDRILSMRTRMPFTLGDFADRFKNLPDKGIYLFKLPNHIDITVTPVDWLSIVISMPPQAGQTGYCGNFNNLAEDDAEPVVPSWDRPIGADLEPIPESEWLFPTESALMLLGEGGKTGKTEEEEEVARRMKRINECPDNLLSKAEEACSGLTAAYHKFCVFDVCLTQDLAAAGSVGSAAFVQHKLNARGVPIFMGHGQCLDQHGKEFRSFSTKLRTDTACQHLLRTLSLTDGVMGAQLKRGSTCEVLTVKEVDPTHVAIPGGWGSPAGPNQEEDVQIRMLPEKKDAPPIKTAARMADGTGGTGTGLVAQTTDDAVYSCWQLN